MICFATQGLVTMNISCSSDPLIEYSSCDNMYILQCVVPSAVDLTSSWTQQNSWIFIIIAIVAAAVIVTVSW